MKRTTKYLNIYKRRDGELIPGGIIHPTRKRAKECSIDGFYPFVYVKTIKIKL